MSLRSTGVGRAGGSGGAVELLARLQHLDVRLWIEDDRLHYSAPKGALDAELKAELGEHKTELLDLLARAHGRDGAGRPPIVAVPRRAAEPLPLSFAQQRLWFLDRFDPGGTTYNLPAAERLTGILDVPALRRSLAEIVRRHEVLRTTFAATGGRPVQRIAPRPEPSLPLVDLTRLAPPRREGECRRLVAAESRRGFDLRSGPLLRTALLELEEQEHVALFTMHHIVSDAWSMGIFRHELMACYRFYAERSPAGSRPPLAELPVQYADFAAWQRRWLSGEVLEAECEHWQERLTGAPPVLELPADRPRPAVQSFAGRSLPTTLPATLSVALNELARRHEATLFMVVLAAFKVLVARLSGQRDLIVGSPIAGRHHREIEGLIGFFVNTLALRTDLAGDPSFLELLARIRRGALDAYAHQDLPFEKLVERLHPERDLGQNPVVQVVFALHNVRMPELELPGLELSLIERRSETSVFDLTLALEEGEAGVRGSWEYSTALFDDVTIARWERHFRLLVQSIAARPEEQIANLDLLAPAERWQLLGEWNDTERPAPDSHESPVVHRRFEAWARRAPDALAVAGPDGHLTYGELARRADRLAHRLRALGVGPEAAVVLVLERSLETAIAMLGTLEAGGCYVPVDPAYPADRIAFIVEDAGAAVVLTLGRFVERIPETAGHRLCLDGDAALLAAEPVGDSAVGVDPRHLAYVIYTSGSTGRPKGVEVTHASLANLVDWHRRTYGVTAGDRASLVAGPAFDASVWETWPYLAAGASLHVAGAAAVVAAPEMIRWLAASAITRAFLPTPLAEAALAEPWPPRMVLSHLLTGGDRLHRGAPPELPCRLVNHYGPTENTVATTWTPVAVTPDGGSAPPIGRPLDNVRAILTGRDVAPVPAGVAGELHAGGAGLARGYRRRPERTAAAFLPDPFAATPGARLYATGDLCRVRSDGAIEFLGRLDLQVKIRGFRIEPGEVESALRGLPGVRDAVAVARGTGDEARLLAYVVTEGDRVTDVAEMRDALKRKLPGYMVPATFVELDDVPLTANGKVDRRALPAPKGTGLDAAGADAPPRNELERRLAALWCEVLGRDRVGIHQNFFDLGGHSLLVVRVTSRLAELLGRDVPVVTMFEHPTISSLVRALEAEPEPAVVAAAPAPVPERRGGEVAIVGMAGRFPGARDVEQFWRNLAGGVESISFLTPEELAASGVDAATARRADYVPARGILEDADLFDAAFFGLNPLEARILDPQQRNFLEVAWQALEDAALDPVRFADAIGVYAGTSLNTYLLRNLATRPDLEETTSAFEVVLGSGRDFLPTRLSYLLDLQGPSISVNTACSTSLVAVHLACQALRDGECDAALAGGVTVSVPQRVGYLHQPDGIQSADGHCRAFDAEATGTVFGDGAGVVVLKRLENAVAAGDRVRAVIRGSAVNNDGYQKIGFTAPSVARQAAVIARAQRAAGVSADDVTYVETHGTGTALGDPVEIRALTRAFRESTERRGFCAIGSVKTNVGHLDSAAGVTGLIKTVLMLEHRRLPASLHFRTPNPEIDFAASPFYVNAAAAEWASDGPRRAGVSSFGIGGTNVHAVLEEPPPAGESGPSRPCQLLVLSARSPGALAAAAANLGGHLEARPDLDLADVAYTLMLGRRAFGERLAVVCTGRDQAIRALAEPPSRQIASSVADHAAPPVAFMFSGQGAQYPNMAREVYEQEEVFRRGVDACSEILLLELGADLRALLYPPAEEAEAAADRLAETAIAQPALFVVELALARLWMSWGVRPVAMIGHSIGEYVAACLAGVLSTEDALALVAARGRLMQEMPAGAMLAVALPEDEAVALLGDDLALAAVNGARRSVVSGSAAAIDRLAARLVADGASHRRLHTSHAFHSAMMDPVLEPFVEAAGKVELRPPRIPFVSNLTGTWIRDQEATDPGYWARHLRSAVRFSAGLGELLADPQRVLLEVGPGTTLTSLAREHPERCPEQASVASLPHPRERRSDLECLATAAGRLWLSGVELDGAAFFAGEHRRPVSLPGYPFERRRYWIDAGDPARPAGRRGAAGAVDKIPEVGEWFYLPTWRSAPAPRAGARGLEEADRPWLVLADGSDLGREVLRRLAAEGRRVVGVAAGRAFARDAAGVTIDPRRAGDYRRLVAGLDDVPGTVLHLWNAPPPAADASSAEVFDDAQVRGYDSLLFLAQALAAAKVERPLRLVVASSGLHDVSGSEATRPELATLLGPLKVIPQEHQSVTTVCVDLDGELGVSEAAGQLLAEAATASEPVVAYRGRRRWVQDFEHIELPAPDSPPLRELGVYLITGGLGNVGLLLAEHLAATARARLVLVGRSEFPARDRWTEWLEAHGEDDATSAKIRRLEAIEAAGAEILIARADVASREEMRAVLERVDERFGGLDGVIHGAGIVAGSSIGRPFTEIGRDESRAQFGPKVYGLVVLEQVLDGRELDFVLLLSSNAAILGGLGFVAYAAANLFMDAFAADRARRGRRWISSNWDGWPAAEETLASGVAQLTMTREESLDAFGRVLAGAPPGQVVVSTADLEARRAVWIRRAVSRQEREEPLLEQRELPSHHVAPRTPVEERLVEIWQNLLGLAPIGVHDDFFELGGHSLLATQLTSRLRRALGVDLALEQVFEAPTVAELAETVEAARRGASGTGEPAERPWWAGERPPIVARSRAAAPRGEPLSFAQQRLWFLDRFDPTSGAYNLSDATRLRGALDVGALRRSVGEIVRRHQVLRTTFGSFDGQPVQRVARRFELPLPVVDLGRLAAASRDGVVRRLGASLTRHPFDLASGPLLRLAVLRLGTKEHVVLLAMHHIVSDGWSIGVFRRELTALYGSHAGGPPAGLPELSVQYADFARWQRRWLSGEVLEAELEHWRRQLGGVPPVLELPTDRPRPAVRTYAGRTLPFVLPKALSRALAALGRRHDATLFMVLLTAFKIQLGRLCGRREVTVGSPIAGRQYDEIEGLIGFFVNTLVLRSDLASDPAFLELLSRVRRVSLAAYEHQALPFEKLVEDLRPERDLGQSPLFQVMFVLRVGGLPELELPGLELSPVALPRTTAAFDLTLSLEEGEDGIFGHWELNRDLFDAATVGRWARHYRCLLESIVARPEAAVSTLGMLPVAERQQVLVEWNDVEAPPRSARETRLHHLVEAQAARTPEAVALAFGDSRWSYRSLDRRANRLAHRLRDLGVGAETLVAICLERSPRLGVAILAVLKAGGAYVPLDPAYPRARLELMLDDTRAPLLLTEERLAERLPASGRVLCLDAEARRIAACPAGSPRAEAGRLAYVIYTSGSTGRPKGVALEHRGAVALVRWARRRFNDRELAGVLFATSVCFDLSIFELFAPLSWGGTVILAENVLELPALPAAGAATLINTVPSAMAELLRLAGVPASARTVNLAGEALPRPLAERIHQLGSVGRVWNLYGPSEDTTYSTEARIEPGDAVVPIGRPLAGGVAYVLDRRLRPVPAGVPAELYLGGPGLARGYLARPALTADRFRPHPSVDPGQQAVGERLYRTGDRVRFLADGQLDFLGRCDFQVKVRGFRIELGEIEAALERHPGVDRSAVVARDDPAGLRLVAFVVWADEAGAVASLREHLRRHLPAHMVPGTFVELAELPRTPSGKVDRAGLARRSLPAFEQAGDAGPRATPRNPIEEMLVALWSRLLGDGARIGIHDDFFELGGHSLLATRVLSRIQAELGVELAVKTIFERRTVAELAQAVAAALREPRLAPPAIPPAIHPVPRDGHLPLSFGQERLWFLDRLDPGKAEYNVPLALEVDGRLDAVALARALAEIARRHEVLRTRFVEVEGGPAQVVDAPLSPALPRIDLRRLSKSRRSAEARRLTLTEARRPFDLARGPLLRATLLALEGRRHVFVLIQHHVVSDGWSIEVLVRELAALYRAFVTGKPPVLPALPVQYADFAAWQRRWLEGEVLAAQLAYWKERLAGAPMVLDLATDRPRPALRSPLGARVPVTLPAALARSLEALGRSRGATLFMTLLAGFETLLYRITGQREVLVGSPIAGRTLPELEPLIGFFVNTLVLRGDLSGSPAFETLVERTRETALAAYAHQDLPFEQLVEELQPERDTSRTPLFQAAFTLASSRARAVELPELRLRPLELDTGTAKFDLTLALVEGAAGGTLRGDLEVATAVFDRTSALRLARHFVTLLASASADPSSPVDALTLLTAAERGQLRLEWNDTGRAYEAAKRCLHRLIGEQVARAPEAVAVVFEDEVLSYGGLARRALRLAGRLRRLGVSADVPVGVCAERSLELVVALLGVLEAGGAYVPFDPEHPRERLAFMLEDSAVAVLLTRRRLAADLPAHGAEVVIFDDGEAEPEAGDVAVAAVAPENLAYTIYTSGSTGRPKGSMNSHRAIVNRLLWMQDAYGLGAGDRVLQKTPFSFDVSVWEFFWPLLTGATLVVARPGGHRDGAYLARLIDAARITTLHFVPSMLQVFLETPGVERCGASLRRVICSGEALAYELQERFFVRLGTGPELHNLYGPTEAAVDVTSWQCLPGRRVPIGRPIANVGVHVLDRSLRPAPVAAPGELHLAGVALARGYLDRPGLTARTFVPNPLADGRAAAQRQGPGTRLYKTGDLTRHLADGPVEYLGRLDHQVKVRGLRIELGEIESVLAGHPGVQEAVVLARTDGAGDPRLVAYCVPDETRAAMVRRELGLEEQDLDGHSLFHLPDGLPILHVGRAEVDFVYREIFEHRAYLRQGVTLEPGDCVFDVGANVGLFSLFAAREAPAVRVFAFEPIPAVYELLRANAELWGVDVRLFNQGLSDAAGSVELTYYPHLSILSGRHADAAQERRAVRAFLRHEEAGDATSGELLDELLDDRLAARRVDCELRTVSQVLRDEEVERVDLLKVDVEKAELEVLRGIDPGDWPKIRQVVVEVHDVEGRLATVRELLAGHGFEVAVEQDTVLEDSGLYNVYARRTVAPDARQRSQPADAIEPSWHSVERLAADLREAASRRLPDYMVPSRIVLLAALPLTPNGKVDRRALGRRELPSAPGARAAYVAPRTAVEQTLAGIWAAALGDVERVGVDDSFFDLGGHSLLATRVISRLRDAFGVELPVGEMFRSRRLGELAAVVERARRTAVAIDMPPLVPVPRDVPPPLSFGQERLWFLDRLDPGNPEYNVPLALEVDGVLDASALARALAEIVRRHEVLRTRFVEVDGRPGQVVDAPRPPALPRIDLERLSEARRSAELRRLALVEARRPFELARGPLLRATLLALEDRRHVFVLIQHHVVSDAWSIDVLVRELAALYRRFASGELASLPELPIQYADFAAWQRRWLEGEVLAAQLAYWKEQLAGALAVLDLATDRPRPALRSPRGARVPVTLPAALARSLERQGRARGATLFMTLLAGFQALLFRITGQRQVLVGSPIAGRTLSELEPLIGFFVNTLVLRGDLSASPAFEALVERTRETALSAYAHQDLPFEQLVEELQPERDTSRTPLFQVAFTLTSPRAGSGGDVIELPELRLSPLELATGTAKFDLTLSLVAGSAGGALRGDLEIATALFDRTTALRLVRHFATLLASAAEDPSTPVDALPLLTGAERGQLRLEWNDTGRPYEPAERCLHRLVREQAARAPDATAVIFEDGYLSYDGLARRALGLASRLRRLGVAADVPVGVCAERSLELVVALLGVLEAGGAYVPFDPEYPRERLVFMLEDSAVAVLLTQRRLAADLPAHGATVVMLDGGAAEPEAGDVAGAAVAPDGLAYTIYTSGSTGRPKGSMNSHRAIVNRLLWMQDAYGLGAGDRVLQKTPFSFDVSVWEFFWPLLTGATLVVARPGGHRDGAYLARLIEAARVTTLHFVPSMLQVFLETPGVEICGASLRRVICSGEALPYELQERFFARLGSGTELHNLYGPTEAAVDVTSWHCLPGHRVPIGRPIANVGVHVLDRTMRPAPVAVAGELLLAGVALARGYLDRPGLTARTFVPNPLADGRSAAQGQGPGSRLYRTGDLTRYLADGPVEYLGRLDHQVKLRGLRIELGEIETVLARHPAVQEAVVLARADGAGDPRLVAYCVPDEEHALTVRRELRLARRDRLPGGEKAEIFQLPDGLPILHVNRNEVDFVYREIFERRTYLRHGVTVEPGDHVFDVGANVGLFALFAAREAPATVYAFEPIPAVYELLAENIRLWGLDARLFNLGLSDVAGRFELTYYPYVSILSGQFADAEEERRAVRSFLAGEMAQEAIEGELVEQLLEDRLSGERVTCELRTVSQVIRDEGVERVDLLKIDVEKAELQVLLGVDDEHWPRIRQVVVEVHDVDGRLRTVRELLAGRGFEIAVEQDTMLRDSALFNVYARRPGERPPRPPAPAPRPAWISAGQLAGELREHVAAALPDYMVPARLELLDALPLAPNGKVDRRELARRPLDGDRASLAEAFVGPRDTLELRLARIWEEVLGVRPVGVRDRFFALGGHSLSAVRVVARIHQATGRELPLTALFQQATVEHLAGLLRRAAGGPAPSPLVAIQPAGSRPPLFCVHPAGGNVLSFFPLAQALGPEQPFYAFQSRGLEDDETPHTTVQEMAADYLAELSKTALTGPRLLAGWSFGGLVAFEMARQLAERGEEVASLVLLDTPAPGGGEPIDEATLDDDAYWLADAGHFLARLAGASAAELGLSHDELRRLAPDDQIERFVERLRQADFLPPGAGALQVRRLLRVYKANARAATVYRPGRYRGGVTLLRAAEALPGAAAPPGDADLGWGHLVDGPVQVFAVPGDHVTLLAPANVEALAARIEAPALQPACQSRW